MNKLALCLLLSLLSLLSGAAPAQEFGHSSLEVTFRATVAATTCVVAVEGGTGDGKSQTVVIGNSSGQVLMDDLLNGTEGATTKFSLQATECPADMPTFYTTIQGEKDTQAQTALANQAHGTGAAQGVGIVIATTAAPDTPLALNSKIDAATFNWRFTDNTLFMQSATAELIARLVPTSGSSNIRTGSVQATAVFHFDYN